MANEIVKVVNGQITVEEAFIAKVKVFNEMKSRFEDEEAKFKRELLKAMEENGIKKYETDDFAITYIAPSTRKGVDTEKLKEDGLYDQYSYATETNASVRIKYKDK